MDEPARDPWCRPRIVFVDGDNAWRRPTHLLLQGQGYEVRSFAGSTAALADAVDRRAACLICGELPEGDALALLDAAGPTTPAILVTACRMPDLPAQGHAAGFATVLTKPLAPRRLVHAVTRLAGPAFG
jgi:FixJ family two-component response regulator